MGPTTREEEDRTNRFLGTNGSDAGSGSVRERAASQPPRTSGQQHFFSSPSQQPFVPSSINVASSPWSNQRLLSPTRQMPTRSSSFSNTNPQQSQFGTTMRERSFPSTFEDDESEFESFDERYIPTSLSRGRTYAQDISRSRSQSLAAGRPTPIGSPYVATPSMASWNESMLSNPVNIPGRYGDIKLPGSSRYGSMGRSPIDVNASSPSRLVRYDISNMSPFVRDVGQILLDDGSAFRELWSGMNPPRDENGGGGSGTTSRRHSVSVVQPRRGAIVGFNAPGAEDVDDHPPFSPSNNYGHGGLMLSDEDLAGDLGLLNLNDNQSPSQPTSQPSSLPIYAPLSRSPPSNDFGYPPINLSKRSPSDASEDQLESRYRQQQQQTPQQQQPSRELHTARFIPGQGIQYYPQTTNFSSPTRARAPSYSNTATSPTSGRGPLPQGQPIHHRLPSSEHELGKGLPLHSVPSSWPLYIVEFKAGRTDLFYLTDLSQDIHVGDLVMVEADRGKDLGKVVNDSITVEEVEAFQRDRQGWAEEDGPVSPGGSGSGAGGGPSKKEINPKMIYGKASTHDAQLLMSKMQDEAKALQLCQSKVRAKKLPMEVVDAEYQWDRRKLTFYFIAEKRIDFRELVRELFRLYKTRIWMASLQGGAGGSYEQ
ncbi:PSP1 C-terminal conserved region-domain-containing protein [Armillaria nabsnona]|nr:PSP1 C-terminal conserved region-domain-containing protein [Armillaria nabsnona]